MNAFTMMLQADWAERVGWTLLHSIWQIALLATGYAIAAVFLRRRSATARYSVGCVLLFAMVACPLSTLLWLTQQPALVSSTVSDSRASTERLKLTPGAIESSSEDSRPVHPPAPLIPGFSEVNAEASTDSSDVSLLLRFMVAVRPWLPWATIVWFIGAVLFSLRPACGWLRVRRLQNHGLSSLKCRPWWAFCGPPCYCPSRS